MEMTEFVEDMTPDEKKDLKEFIANGLPGLSKIDDSDVFQWLNLYMAGKTYAEISKVAKIKKNVVLYVASKGKWHDQRIQQYTELSIHLIDKIKRAKVESVDTVTNMISSMGLYVNGEMTKFLKTQNKEVLEKLDTKVMSSYFKSIETLDKLVGNASKAGAPSINLNLNGGNNTEQPKVESKEDGIEITTTNESGDTLSLLARYKKEQNK